jgi:hypothetical protein
MGDPDLTCRQVLFGLNSNRVTLALADHVEQLGVGTLRIYPLRDIRHKPRAKHRKLLEA